MSIYGSLESALATIPGMTLGTNLWSPEHPRVSAGTHLPSITIKRITDDGDYSLTVSRVMNRDRFQLTFAAASQVTLDALVIAAHAALNGKKTTFSGFPYGRGADGYDPVPSTNWATSDWIICY